MITQDYEEKPKSNFSFSLIRFKGHFGAKARVLGNQSQLFTTNSSALVRPGT